MRRRAFLLVSAAGALLGQMLNPWLGRSAQLPVPGRREAADPSQVVDQGPAGEQSPAVEPATDLEPSPATDRGKVSDVRTAGAPTLDVASAAEFTSKGQLLIPKSPLGPVLVIRDRATEQLKAVNPTCPHRGCMVDWNGSSDMFLCPCHQARFNADGRWIGGKAVRRPLERYKVTVANGRILVSPV